VGRFRVPGPPTIIASLWGDAGESTTVFQGATVTESAARRMPNPGDLLNGLFPVSPAGAFRGRSALIATAAVLIGTFAQVIRLPGNTAYSTIWAEDASIFLNQALNKGILRSFTIPYAGYLHTVPRVIAAVAAVFPLQWAAAIFGIGSALVVSLLGVFLYRATEGLIHSVPMRLALSAMFVAIPVVGFETEANAANLHFYFDFVAIWALLWRPQSRIGTAASAAVCFLAAASDAITLFLLPIAIARLLVTRFGRGSAPAFALIAGLLIQLPVIVTSHDTHWAPNIPLDFAAVFSTRVALPFLVGGLLSNRLWADISWIAPAVAGLILCAGIVWLTFTRRIGPVAWVALIFIAGAIVFAGLPIIDRWEMAMYPKAGALLEIPARYWGVPLLMLWSSVAIVVTSDTVRTWLGTQHHRILVRVTVVWLTCILAADFVVIGGNPFRDDGLRWNQQLASAATTCHVHRVNHVAFSVLFRKYIIVLPCDRITGSASG
jgi:hypothetical protein